MEYWRGMMNWPIETEARCETCDMAFLSQLSGFPIACSLTWGLVNGECRCDYCHTKYMMRSGDAILTKPISRLKEEYKEAARIGWQRFGTHIDTWTKDQWDELKEITN
jgi:hypothetical protein